MQPHFIESPPKSYLVDSKARHRILEREYLLSALILEFLLFLYFSYLHPDYFYIVPGMIISLAAIIFLVYPRRWSTGRKKYRTTLFIFSGLFLLLMQGFFLACFNVLFENLVLIIPVILMALTFLYFSPSEVHEVRGGVTLFIFNLYLISLLLMYISFFKFHNFSLYPWYILTLITGIMPYAYVYSFLKPSTNAVLCLIFSIIFYFMSWGVISALSWYDSFSNIPAYYGTMEFTAVFLVNPMAGYIFSYQRRKTNK